MKQRFFNHDLSAVTLKLTSLRDDLSAQLDGTGPDNEVLATSPIIDQWRIRYVPMPVIAGRVTGHPKIFDGAVATTGIWYLQEDLRWARTLSRYYRLGEYVGDGATLRAGLIPPRRRNQPH